MVDNYSDENLPQVNAPYLAGPSEKEYTLVLDMDETLIHFSDDEHENFYMIRPGLNKFLSDMSIHYELVVYTAALKDYADWILNQIDRKKLIKHRLYREYTQRQENCAIKDLRLLGRDLAKTIIIDNIPENFMSTTPDNGLSIVSWFDDMEDKELERYASFLTKLAAKKVQDVRPIIREYRDDLSAFE